MIFTRNYIEKIVIGLVINNPHNHLEDFNGIPAFQQPKIGIADGDDLIFRTFKKAVSSRHIMPRAILKKYSKPGTDLSRVLVVSWILPFSQEVRRSNRKGRWPSTLYSLARNNGGRLNREVCKKLVSMIRAKGFAAVSPLLTDEIDSFRSRKYTFSSTWSERHVAYACRLGKFALNGSMITPVGSNVRFGSIITNIPLEADQHRTETHKANTRNIGIYKAECIIKKGKNCGACIKKCPFGAISANGFDKEKCYNMKKEIEARFMDEYKKRLHMFKNIIAKKGKKIKGISLGCALCQCGVPCEAKDPFRK
ncbi:hypothetical protein ACFL6D_03150 [Spirochaetota bacterium]